MTEMSAFQLSVTMGITMMTTVRVMRVACNNGQLFACQLEFESVFTELLRSYSVPDLNFMRQNLHQLSHKSITSALTRSVSRKRPSHSHYRIILNHVRLQTPKKETDEIFPIIFVPYQQELRPVSSSPTLKPFHCSLPSNAQENFYCLLSKMRQFTSR